MAQGAVQEYSLDGVEGLDGRELGGIEPEKSEYDISGLNLESDDSPARAGMRLNFRAGKITPEQAQQAYAMTQKTQLPQSAVLSNMQNLQSALEEYDLDTFGQKSPRAAGWMSQDVIRTNIARDDTYTLEGVEGLLQDKGTWDLTKEAYAQSKDTMGDIELFERHMSGDRSPELLDAMKKVHERKQAQARETQKPEGLWQEFAVNTAEQLPIQEVILSERAKGYLVGPSAGAVIGSAIPGAGTLVGAAAGAFAGPAAYSATAAYRLESAFAYGDFLQEGIPDDTAAIAARVYGVGASVIEFADSLIDTSILGFSMNSAGKQTAKMTLKGALSGLVKNVAKGKLSETAEEMAQQGLQIVVGEVTKLFTGTESDKTPDAAVGEVLEAGWKTLWSAWGAESGTIRFGLDVRDARNGGGAAYVRDMALAAGQQREQEILSSLDDLSANSKLAQRDPGLYEEAVRAMNQDGQVQNVYIPAGGLSAVMGGSEAIANDPAASQRLSGVLDMLDVSGEDFSLTLAGGTDLVIPIEKYAAAVAQDKEFAALIAQDRRLTSDGFTVRELQQWARDNESSLREAVKAAALSGRQPTQLEAETQEISYAVQAQLETTGQPRDVAAANAAQVAAVFGTLSQRAGTSPMQLWGMYAPDVAQEGGFTVEAAEVLPVASDSGAKQQPTGGIVQNSGGTENPRGRIVTSTPSGRPLITLFQQADASTFLHESGHLYLEMVKSLGTAQNAVPELIFMWQEVQDILARTTGQNVFDDSGNIATSAHELWASSLENYFRKGEAPSVELRNVFQKFGAWLKAVYNAFRSFGVAPTQDLDGVFGRLLATDAQIEEVQQWHEAQKPWATIMGANEQEIVERRAEAEAEAKAKRIKTLSRAYMEALGGRKLFYAEAKTTVEAMPVYAAMDEAASGIGIDIATVRSLIGEERVKTLNKKRPKLLRLEGGEDPMILAAMHGFDSTEEMLGAMLEAEGKKITIAKLAAQAEQQARDTVAQGFAENETMPGDVEYHSDAQLSVLLAEKQLVDKKRTRAANSSERPRNAVSEAKAMREAARQTVSSLPVSQAMEAHRHSLAERRAAKAAWVAAKEGNWEKAAEHKRQEAVSHAMYLAAMEAREAVETSTKAVKKLVGAKKLSPDARDILHDVAYRFGILSYGGSVTDSYAAWKTAAQRDQRDFPALRKWAEDVTTLGYPVFIEDFIINGWGAQDYRQMPLSSFGSVIDAMRNIYKVDRMESTATLNGKRVEIAELVNALETAASAHKSLDERDKYKKEFIKKGLGGIHAAHAKMEAIALDLDGWEHGVWWETFFLPIADAEDHQNEMLKDMNTSLQGLVAGMMPSLRDKHAFFNDRTLIEGTGGKKGMTMNEIVSAALNTGNGVNKQRLLEGEEWTQETLDTVLSHMDEKHWSFVQGVWDYFETFKEASFALQREVTGITPKAVEAEPFEVKTKDGKALSLRGGYYPISYSPEHGAKAFSQEQKELNAQLFGGRNYGAAMTKHGHVKERSSKGTGERLQLDIGVIADHLYNAAHDISHRKAVIEVAKLIRNKAVMGVIEKYTGPEVARQFMPWIQNVANEMQSSDNMGFLHKMARWARRGASIMAMGFKVTTAYVQITGFTQTMAVLGKKYTALGYHRAFARDGSIFKQANNIKAMSTFMDNRLNSFDREVRDATKNITMRGSVLANTERLAYLPMGLMQFYAVDVPTWIGAHTKALAEGKDDHAAIAYADSIVRLTQTSGSIKDLSRIQRGSDVERILTMFYSFFSALYQLAWRAKAMTKNEGAAWLAGQALLLWFVPAVISELLTGRGPDEDDGEEWAPWMGKKIATYPAQMLIGVRDLVNAIAEPDFGYRGTPAVGSPQSIVRFVSSVQKAIEEEDPSLMVKPGVKMIGHVGILPLGQPVITIGNMYDYMTGETPDFQLRDLFFTKQKSRRAH